MASTCAFQSFRKMEVNANMLTYCIIGADGMTKSSQFENNRLMAAARVGLASASLSKLVMIAAKNSLQFN